MQLSQSRKDLYMRLRAKSSASSSQLSQHYSHATVPQQPVMSIPSETSTEDLAVRDVSIDEKPFDASLTDDD